MPWELNGQSSGKLTPHRFVDERFECIFGRDIDLSEIGTLAYHSKLPVALHNDSVLLATAKDNQGEEFPLAAYRRTQSGVVLGLNLLPESWAQKGNHAMSRFINAAIIYGATL